MRIESRSRRASTATRPASGLPAARRASGASIPWSTALRTRWASGSPSRSRIERSSSSSAPERSTSTRLPVPCATSRARRGRLSSTRWSGVVRRSRTRRRSSPTTRSMRSKPDASCALLAAAVPAALRSWLELRITSPTLERKRSSVSVRTRTQGGAAGAAARAGGAAAGPLPTLFF